MASPLISPNIKYTTCRSPRTQPFPSWHVMLLKLYLLVCLFHVSLFRSLSFVIDKCHFQRIILEWINDILYYLLLEN